MVVDKESIMNIMGGMENSVGVRLHNHRKKLRQRFDIKGKLGQGTYGKVQLGINKETGQEVAIKTIRKSKIETEADLIRIRREIQIMSSVQHPNIIHIYEVFENREKIVLVMEYAAGGELYDFLNKEKKLAEDEARRIFRQIATAVYYCHKHKICHRDLKLENILLDKDNNAKIADFGLSNVFGGTRLMETYCGSPLYASPEIVLGIPYHGPEVDCWSLGVLLYTLVYGAMPFDGSHFKRLVKQISEADYFEPKNPSPASPLIAIMLTVSSKKRADIVRICKHWWVNEGQPDGCLDIAEHLASQTPVRLDLLLSLAPPVSSENVVVTKDMETNDGVMGTATNEGPIRSHSVDSIMKVDQKDLPDFKMQKDRRPKEADNHIGSGAKRDLTSTSAAEGARASKRVARTRPSTKKKSSASEKYSEDGSEAPFEGEPLQRSESKEQTLAAAVALAVEAAEAAEAAEATETAANAKEELKPPAVEAGGSGESSPSEPSVEEIKNNMNGDSQETSTGVVSIACSSSAPPAAFADKADTTIVDESAKTETEEPAVPPTKITERRKSKIFETAEKFNNLAESKTAPEKNRKVFIPGVKVSDAKAAFERKKKEGDEPRRPSLTPAVEKKPATPTTPTTPPTPTPQSAQIGTPSQPQPQPQQLPKEQEVSKNDPVDPELLKRELENRKKVKDAVDIIGRKLSLKKKLPPLVTSLSETGSGSPGSPGSPSTVDPATGMKTVRVQVAPNDIRLATIQVATPQATKFAGESPLANQAASLPVDEPRKSSKVEITLKSATLPRRKTSQPEVPLAPVKAPSPERNICAPRRASVGQPVPSYRSEVEHMVGGFDHPNRPRHQRSEVSFPVAAAGSAARIHPSTVRSASLEPESKLKSRPREHIIPIRLEDDAPRTITPPARPPVPPGSSSTHLPYQRSLSARSTSLSRQSTQDSDTDSTVSASGGEPIKKSQREYIIPIAVEGGGYVTPRASSLEPGEDWSRTSGHSLPRSRLSRPKRMSSLFSESDDERESLNSEDRRGGMDLHRLRSSRPSRKTLEHTDSLSSAEEEDDDEGFEILTAENLFSSLLSRVRSLTQRLNVEDGGRPGFPASRLLNQLHASRAGSPFWTGSVFNRAPLEPLSRNTGLTTVRTITTTRTTRVSEATRSLSQDTENSGPTPWRRSVSRDTSDTESVSSGTIPRGRRAEHCNSGDFSEPSYSYSPSVSDCLSAPTSRRASRDLASNRRYTGGFSSARRAARALEEELNQPTTYNRRLGRTMSMRNPLDTQEKELPPLPYVPKRLSGYPSGLRNSTDGMTMSCPASTFSTRDESIRSPSLLRSTSLSREERPSDRLTHERPALERYSTDRRTSLGLASDRRSSTLDRFSSGLSSDRLSSGLTSDRLSSGMSSDRLSGLTDRLSSLASDRLSSGLTSDRLSSDRLGPDRATERPTLDRFLSERPVTESSTLGRQSKGRRISRFLRPDFYDTPRESSIYAKERDLMKASKTEKETPSNNLLTQSLESRIESTIRSLRESSLGPKDLDGAPTESSLLRRAVSVSDFTPNVKLGSLTDSSVPRRIPSYRKYTGTISDTSLLLDGSNIEHKDSPSKVASESASKVTTIKKKKISSKGSSSTIGKKRVATSPPKALDGSKTVDDNATGISTSPESKTEDRPALTDLQVPNESSNVESTDVKSNLEIPASTKVSSKVIGSGGTSKVRSLSKIGGSSSDLSSSSKVRSGSKIGGSTLDLSANNGATKERSTVKSSDSTTNLTAVGVIDSTVIKDFKDRSSVRTSGSASNLSAGTSDTATTKTTKERTSEKNVGSTTNLSSIGTSDSASKSPKERSSIKRSITTSSASSTAESTDSKSVKDRSSVKNSGSTANLPIVTATESTTSKMLKERRSVKSCASTTTSSPTDTTDSTVSKVNKERSPVKSSGSVTNMSAAVASEPLTSKVIKERVSVKSSRSISNLSSTVTSEPATVKVIKERSTGTVKSGGSTSNLTAVGTSDSAVSKPAKERSAVKINGSTTNLSLGDLESVPKIPKERSSVKRNGSTTNLSPVGTFEVPASKIAKEVRSVKNSTSSSMPATPPEEKGDSSGSASKEQTAVKACNLSSTSSSPSTATKTQSAATSNGNPPLPSTANATDPAQGMSTAKSGEMSAPSSALKSITKGPDSVDIVKSTSEISANKIIKRRTSVKSSGSTTNLTAAGTADSLTKGTKERTLKSSGASSSSVANAVTAESSTSIVTKDRNVIKTTGSSSNLASAPIKVSTVSPTPKSTSDASSPPRRVRSITKMSDLSSSNLPKVPSLARISKNTTENSAAGKAEPSGSPPSPTKMRGVPKPSGSMTDISRTSPTKIRSLSKIGSSTERINTSPTKLRTVKAAGSSSDIINSLSKVPSASKLSKNAIDSPRTGIKAPGNDVPITSSLPVSKVARSSSGLLITENTTSVKAPVSLSVSPQKIVKPSVRKSENDAKTNGVLRSVRSATESPSVSPTKRLFGSTASTGTSPIPGKRSPMPGQSSPRPVHRRNSISQPMPSRRSSSHNRRGRSTSSVEPEDIPVISLKDVERRHRAMLLDRWSQSLQSLHLEREKAKAEAESKSEPKTDLKPETKSEPTGGEIKLELKVDAKAEPKDMESKEEPKCEIKPDGSKGRIPRLSSQNTLNETLTKPATPPKATTTSAENRPKTLSLKITSVNDILLSPTESEALESPHSAVTSPVSEDMESVSDRIRRKSFYSRFNDVKKKKRSPSASASSLLPSYTLTSRTHYPIEYTRSLSCGISGPERGRLYSGTSNGTTDDALLRPARKDRSPSWERSNMEIQNDFLFHNLGLHRFDPNNLSTNKETLFGMLSPTNDVPNPLLGASNSASSIAASDAGEAAADTAAPAPTETTVPTPVTDTVADADVVVTLPSPKAATNKT